MTDDPSGSDSRNPFPDGLGWSRMPPASGDTARPDSHPDRRRIGNRAVLPAVALAAAWAEILFDPTIRALVLGMTAALGCALGLLLLAMALGGWGSAFSPCLTGFGIPCFVRADGRINKKMIG
ncbi:MAG: hypothetical protein ABS79_01405 [Planctomycetes bacterium SCN 63-9]|nr:MAG: hypothetical protein ABS79_01405 [Planctomycetes bacterium SCN 63-9]